MVLKAVNLTWDKTCLSLHLRKAFRKEQNQTDLVIPGAGQVLHTSKNGFYRSVHAAGIGMKIVDNPSM